MGPIIRIFGVTIAAVLVAAGPAAAALDVQKVADGVYALVGPLEQRNAENLGNNATFGAVVTNDGVVLIDSGGSAAGAQEIEEALATVTDQPVRLVINSGGQDHRWFGNGWFRDQGARIIAAEAAVADHASRLDDQFATMRAMVGEATLKGTTPVTASETFDDALDLTHGGVRFELWMVGPAHTPGDTIVWLPESRVVFAGDVVYMDRMLGVGPQSDSRHWLEAFERIIALEPVIVVPGHGAPAPLSKARAETYDYLRHLRAEVGKVIEANGDEVAATKVDQSPFAHLAVFTEISGRNAQQVFMQMEWE
ncbi:MAG: MBL fold metallo-hydrolase [Rhodospirillaceae bacterium]